MGVMQYNPHPQVCKPPLPPGGYPPPPKIAPSLSDHHCTGQRLLGAKMALRLFWGPGIATTLISTVIVQWPKKFVAC